jgi:hypothetical protein
MRLIRYTLAFALFAFLAIPAAAQTDTAAATTLKDLRRACATTTAKRSYGYLCDDTTLVKRWPSSQPPTPTPIPTPTPTPIPTPIPVPAPASGDAELPRVFLNTAMSNTPSPGRTLRVGLPGGTVQAALDSSVAGDRIVIPCGAHLAEEAHWRKNGAAWTTLTSDCPLPPEGTRMDSVTGKTLAWIESPTVNAALTADLSSGHLRVIGIRLSNSPSLGTVNSTVLLGSAGSDQSQLFQVPTDIILDRVYIGVPDTQDDRRCISLQSARSAIINSCVANCKAPSTRRRSRDEWPRPLPHREQLPRSDGREHQFRWWRSAHPRLGPERHRRSAATTSSSGSTGRTNQWGANEKNLLESKNSSRVLVEGNVFENSWVGGQYGWVFALYSVNQDGQCTWCVTEHWTIRNNLAKNVTSFATITGRLSNFPTALPIKAHHITVRNNLVVGLNPTFLQGVGKVFQIWDVANLTIEHNTGFGSDAGFSFDQAQPTGVVIRNNLVAGCYPVFSGGGQGTAALDVRHRPGSGVRRECVLRLWEYAVRRDESGAGQPLPERRWPGSMTAARTRISRDDGPGATRLSRRRGPVQGQGDRWQRSRRRRGGDSRGDARASSSQRA